MKFTLLNLIKPAKVNRFELVNALLCILAIHIPRDEAKPIGLEGDTCPSVKGERACQLEAALAIDPVPSRTDPLNVANNAQVARKQRILFRETPFYLLFKQAMFVSPFPCSRKACVRNRMGPYRSAYEGKCTGKAETDEPQ